MNDIVMSNNNRAKQIVEKTKSGVYTYYSRKANVINLSITSMRILQCTKFFVLKHRYITAVV